ncbi:MAG: hypothetical protein A3A65_02745 [Candidatus Chisholmbacteria bacterium RIFCSPLOWO2_01_FULL_49_14]|uniref:Uncharacterized protein n=1 Tax=Candidatus Chisholmbacteria bacterium RIFCSPLOWO2_01_FULL_49_14 TaxID=1797593 RepID=A0A1G1VZQ6_9BACT|nr:MAG: hypothetical protein A3A65_02745 [Candidatus Chisholmbacteria bacterium RIFCSPLOWO2_01_FULL_49_14]
MIEDAYTQASTKRITISTILMRRSLLLACSRLLQVVVLNVSGMFHNNLKKLFLNKFSFKNDEYD